MIDPAARARLEWWKLSLLDLDPSVADNPLLDARPSETCVVIPAIDPIALATRLASGASIAIAAESSSSPAAENDDTRPIAIGALVTALGPLDLSNRLVAIRRVTRAGRADRGVHGAWLALGTLVWCDANQVSHAAPLVLWPIELEQDDGGVRIVAADGIEPRFNHVLGEKLARDFEILIGQFDRMDPDALAPVFEVAESIALTRPGWLVERAGRIGWFEIASHSVWRDLEDRGDDVLAAPVVSHLALGTGIGFAQPSPDAAGAVTSRVRREELANVLAPLDADTSQLQVVAAAGAGASFVVQAAPGTGASQTIANLVAHCAAHGKSTLVVSTKIAALDAVHQRLSSVGLGELCLELHRTNQGANHAQVVGQLHRLVERAFRPSIDSVGGPSGDVRLAELRDRLDAHTAAMHRVGPFGRSMHEVLGRLVELRTTPRAQLADSDAIGLDAATFERRAEAVRQLADAAVAVEPVASHPWRHSTLAPPDVGDANMFSPPQPGCGSPQLGSGAWRDAVAASAGRERALAAIDAAAAAATSLGAAIRDVARLVPGLVARTCEQVELLGALAAVATTSPRPGGELLTHLRNARTDELDEEIALIRARGAGVLEPPRDPLAFLHIAARQRALAAEVDECFLEGLDRLDVAGLWGQLRKWTNSLAPVRFVALRSARAEIQAAGSIDKKRGDKLTNDASMMAALEAVLAERACRAALEAAAEPARRWFGELGGDPLALDLPKLDAAVAWASELRRAFDRVDVIGGEPGRGAAWRALVAQVASSHVERVEPAPELLMFAESPGGTAPFDSTDLAVFARLADAVARWQPALAELTAATGIDRQILTMGDDHLATLRERAETLRHGIDGLGPWVAFHRARHRALAAGVGPAVRALERGDLAASELALAWERATLLAWTVAELSSTESLATFHGSAHHAHVAAFADLDRAALALVRSRVFARLAGASPRTGGEGELEALLEGLRSSGSLREVLAASRSLVFRIAPCVLATPHAVVEYLDPSLPRFDVVVIDEAGLMPSGQAIVALSRGESAVIVGDSRLLRSSADNILDDCLAARLPELRLAWHYGSRHEDLLAFANERYYGDRLYGLPAALPSPDLGVAWRRVDGAPDPAGANRVEAEAIVAEVFTRLRDPAQRTRSIAVVAFSRAQQELIEDLLDAARASDQTGAKPAVSSSELAEPLIVTTVDDAQGHVRDVVLLSLGFGADVLPLAEELGARRLAVAITRAREQLLVVSSFAPEDIVSEATGLRDLADLLAWVEIARRRARPTTDEPASPITAAIARALDERGWITRHQVGSGAYKIDLAIVDPNEPDRYVIAIECDGAAYASGPSARDRDRLRPQVLAQLGWRLHRIWSLDWWMDPEREIARAHAAIVTAIAAGRQRRAPVPRVGARPRIARASGSAPVVVDAPKDGAPVQPLDGATLPNLAAGSSPVRLARNAIPIGPYTAAAIPPGRRTPDDLFAPRHLAELGKVVEQVLAAEAPMHVELLARRVGAYFGIGRVTQRVADQIRTALDGRGKWGDEEDVVWRLDQDPAAVPPVRVAGNSPTGKRDIEQIPLSELAAAARIVVERAGGIGTSELIRDAARLMGFARITDDVTSRVTLGVKLAQVRELIAIDTGSGKALLPD